MSEKISLGLYEHKKLRWGKMSRCTGNDRYVTVSSLAITWKLRGTGKRSLKGQCLLYIHKEELKLRVKGYNKARYVPSAIVSSCIRQTQLGQGSLSIYTAGSQLRTNFRSNFSLLLLTALLIDIFRSSPQKARQIFAKL